MIRQQNTIQDLYADYFSHTNRMDLQLVQEQSDGSAISPIFIHPVYVAKNNLPEVYADPFLVMLGDKIIDYMNTEDMRLYAEQHRVKLPEHMKDSIVPTLFVDNDAPDSIWQSLTDYYRTEDFERVATMYIDTVSQPDTVLFQPKWIELN